MQTTARVRALLQPELMGWASANIDDVKAHLQRLIFPGFLTRTAPALLAQLPRYLKALQLRLERALQDPVKDQARMLEMQPFNSALSLPQVRADFEFPEFCQAVEELNVQVFAQEFALKGAVSRKAVAKQLARLTSRV
jgi:ATP-dependent helicase HrpA